MTNRHNKSHKSQKSGGKYVHHELPFPQLPRSNKTNSRHNSHKNTSGGVGKQKHHDKNTKKADMRKAKAHAPTAEELDSELARYMGHEYVAKKLDEELDAYFKSGDAESH